MGPLLDPNTIVVLLRGPLNGGLKGVYLALNGPILGHSRNVLPQHDLMVFRGSRDRPHFGPILVPFRGPKGAQMGPLFIPPIWALLEIRLPYTGPRALHPVYLALCGARDGTI